MNDTLSIKKLPGANANAALDATARSFERAASSVRNEWLRRSTFLGSLNPSDLTIAHQPRSAKNTVQRTRIGYSQTLTRLDALNNVLSTNVVPLALICPIEQAVTEQEFVDVLSHFVGLLVANDYAFPRACHRTEF